ncbi:MAG: preprotein translocase subunit SecD [Blastocatellia bacterium]
MGKKIRNRMLIILLVTLVGVAIIFKPHHKLTTQDFTSWTQIKQNLGENIHLGLDLKGGSHLVMQVQVDDVIK